MIWAIAWWLVSSAASVWFAFWAAQRSERREAERWARALTSSAVALRECRCSPEFLRGHGWTIEHVTAHVAESRDRDE